MRGSVPGSPPEGRDVHLATFRHGRLDGSGPAGATEQGTRVRPGTRLVRAWHGRTYLVTATENGFTYEGETYGSLSAVAHHITGAHWSGPRFFGLRPAGQRAAVASEAGDG